MIFNPFWRGARTPQVKSFTPDETLSYNAESQILSAVPPVSPYGSGTSTGTNTGDQIAATVPYDDSGTVLGATDVQGAIEALDGLVGGGSSTTARSFVPGMDGADGEDGWMGPPGPVSPGTPGAAGATGAQGAAGSFIPGWDGVDGDDSLVGPPGPVGPTGATGATGAAASPSGLFNQIMSATPTSAGTGFSTWVNQGGTATVTDTAVGISIYDGTTGGSTVLRGRKKAVPVSTPYSAIALFTLDLNTGIPFSQCFFGWTDGTKLQLLDFQWATATALRLSVDNYSDTTHYAGTTPAGPVQWQTGGPCWVKLHDDGTNISFNYGFNGAVWVPFYTVAKSSGYLGSSGYSSLIFGVAPQGTLAGITMVSYAETA